MHPSQSFCVTVFGHQAHLAASYQITVTDNSRECQYNGVSRFYSKSQSDLTSD